MDVRVLDTTIRDGSYEIAHQFTEEDVALVVGTLDAAGVGLIEIGHGWGVGNEQFAKANRPKVRAVLDDAAQMRIGRASKRRARLGVMLVAGDAFSPVEYLDEIAAAGMDFVRLAYMPSDITPANLRYIERARALGLTVSVNCTQSYILPPREIGQLAALARRAGADWWYVVDSAGGMQPGEVGDYIRAVRDATDIAVGLHAHNNLGLAVANSLAAVDAGATLVDCTLNGLGRATGNAPTEQLILALQGRGHRVAIDVEPIARLSSMYRALFAAKGTDPMHVVSGAAMLHSRNLPAITAQAAERGLSLADFMLRVGREARQARCLDKFEFPAQVFDRAAADCRRAGASTPATPLVHTIAERLTARRASGIAQVCEDLAVRAARHHVPSVLHLVPADRFPFAGALPWQSAALVGATIAWPGAVDLALDRRPSYLLVDRALAATPDLPTARQRTFHCHWDDLWIDAIRAAVAAAGLDHVWSPAGDVTLRTRLEAAGFPLAHDRGTSPRAFAVARSAELSLQQLRTGDLVLLLDHGPDARAAADAIRQAGAQAIAPPIGTIIAARALELATISAQLSAPNATGAWVEPHVAPGRGHAIVDVALSSIIDPGPHALAPLAHDVADARARSLTDGTGTP